MKSFLAPIIAVSLFLQGSLFSFPLVFVFLINYAIKEKKNLVFPLAFILGLVIDSFRLRPLGETSLFFLIFLFALFTYERKFEIDNLSFIFVASFLGSVALFLISGETNLILKSFLVSVFAAGVSKTW